jgi:hypothetical protein
MIDYSVFGYDVFGDLMIDHNSRCVANKTYFCMEIDARRANKLIEKFHYSHKIVTNSNLHLGLFDVKGKLKGVLSFGPSMNGTATANKFSDDISMVELNRMVMDDDQPRNSESCAIGLCVKFLKRFRKDIHWILSFSDGKENNVGYIYQATNWKYLGFLSSDSFYDLDGDIIHAVTVWHRYKENHPERDTKTTHEILYDNFENVSRIHCRQHIYVMPLCSVTFLETTKPYPKLETEIPIQKRVFLKRSGVICDPPEHIKYDPTS